MTGPPRVDAMTDLDLAIWIDAEQVVKTFRQQIDAGLAFLSMMQPAGSLQAAASGQDQLKMLVDGASSFLIGVSLADSGVGLRFVMGVSPGSEMAKQVKIVTTTKPLLNGLPPDSYMIAFGETVDPEATKASSWGPSSNSRLMSVVVTWMSRGRPRVISLRRMCVSARVHDVPHPVL